MARTDTAGFYYKPSSSGAAYLGFYGHRKGQKVNPYPCTPYPECTYGSGGSGTDYCEECEELMKSTYGDDVTFECDAANKKCQRITKGTSSDTPGSIDTEVETRTDIIIKDKLTTDETECDTFVRRGSGVKINGGIATGANATSGGSWKFSGDCYTMIQFYGRLNNNDVNTSIRYGALNTEINFRTGAAADNLNIYKFTIKGNGEYVIELSEADGDGYADYIIYETGKISQPEEDYTGFIIAGVHGGAQIWGVTVRDNVGTVKVITPDVEPLVYAQQFRGQYNWESYGTVESKTNKVKGVTPTFLGLNEGETKDGCTYENGVVTVKKYTSSNKEMFKYVASQQMPHPYGYEFSQWILDLKFIPIPPDGDDWGFEDDIYIHLGYRALSNFYMQDFIVDKEVWDFRNYDQLVGKECRFQMESYCNHTGEYECYARLYTYNTTTEQWDLLKSQDYWLRPDNFLNYYAYYPYVGIELGQYSDATSIEIYYAAEGKYNGRPLD